MLTRTKLLLVFSLLLLLAGCAAMRAPTTAPAVAWPQRSDQLMALQSWTVNGAVSIQHDQKVQSASLNWRQQRDHYYLSLFGPLGLGRVEINGAPGAITLIMPNRPVMTAASPEQLLQQQLGWQLPMSHLQTWIRGLPVAGVSANTTFDAAGRLAHLQQEGWQIDYLDYIQVGMLQLPHKMQLTTEGLRVKLVLRQWAF